MRILVISLVVHAIGLPIAARFGAFEKLKKEFGTSRVVMVTMPPIEAEKPKVAEKTQKKTAAAKKSGGAAPKASAAQKSGLPQPKVVAAGGTGDGSGDGPTVDANGSGKAGVLPPTEPGTETVKPPEPPPIVPETKPETPPVVAAKTVDPPVAPPKVDPSPVVKPKPFVEADVIDAPVPVIPDEMRSEPFEKTLVVEADVDTSGKPLNVQIATSTGQKQLDAAGLDAARRYRFRPATLGGEAVAQHVRFRIIFKVE